MHNLDSLRLQKLNDRNEISIRRDQNSHIVVVGPGQANFPLQKNRDTPRGVPEETDATKGIHARQLVDLSLTLSARRPLDGL